MSVVVELTPVAVGDLCVMRVTMSRVPSVNEIIRVLATVNEMTSAFCFQVTRVMHNANTDAYPKRKQEIDAWVDCVAVKGHP